MSTKRIRRVFIHNITHNINMYIIMVIDCIFNSLQTLIFIYEIETSF